MGHRGRSASKTQRNIFKYRGGLYDEVWNHRRYDVAGELFHPEFRTPAAPGLGH